MYDFSNCFLYQTNRDDAEGSPDIGVRGVGVGGVDVGVIVPDTTPPEGVADEKETAVVDVEEDGVALDVLA